MSHEIYLDANATSYVLPAAIDAAQHAMCERFGNPSSTHATGLKARALLDGVREKAVRVLGAGQGSVIFTSGATESIGTAVLSALCALRERQAQGEATGNLLVYGATEHKAVPESLAHWNRVLGMGLELRALPVNELGQPDLALLRAWAPQAAMVCTMAANNETGAVADLDGIEAALAGSKAYWMVDSVQALGKLELNLAGRRIDYAPFSGHKLYAPKGIGMLYVRAGSPYTNLMAGGGQEAGLRAGTENMSGIAALGAVLSAMEEGSTFRSHDELEAFRGRLAQALRKALPGIVFNMPFEGSLPTTLNFSVPGFSSQELLNLFDAAGVRVSSGSACSSAKAAPSYVLVAMQRPDWCAAAAVRMSFGPLADSAFIDAAVERIARCGAALRSSCLIPSDVAPRSRDGVIQLSANGECSWIVADTATRSCAIIDPVHELAERINAFVRCQGYSVRAVLETHARPSSAAASLRSAFAPAGWNASATLGDGSTVPALSIGEYVLADLGEGYLLGHHALYAEQVRFAFTGASLLPGGLSEGMPIGALRSGVQRLASLINCDTILCPGQDPEQHICATTAMLSRRSGVLAELLAVQPRLTRATLPPMEGASALAPAALDRFLASHPDAMLVDVREAFEHAADRLDCVAGHAVHSIPLSHLAASLAQWLPGEQRPIVFFCRSGARGARAAACLHRLGYQNAWHLAGGADSMLGPLAMAA